MSEERLSADQLAEQYIKLRTERALLQEEYENQDALIKAEMDAISENLLSICKEQDASSIRTEHGTIIRSVTSRYWTNDWGAMHELINKYKAPYLLEKRIMNSAMKEFLEEYPEAYPPGLNVDSKYTITVRKPTKKI
jgi:hypothetical protein